MKMQTKTFTAEKDRGKSMEKKDQTRYDKAMVNRIARATGHLKMVRDMVEQERDCSEVLIQLAAVKSAVNGAGKEILKQYMEECVDQELRQQDNEGLGKLKKGIDSFMK
ncbi:MAG: metal-sensing transcriptional repressor [Blautia hansenii]|jgi:DNA-binding FrmR family transcriptional regulator